MTDLRDLEAAQRFADDELTGRAAQWLEAFIDQLQAEKRHPEKVTASQTAHELAEFAATHTTDELRKHVEAKAKA